MEGASASSFVDASLHHVHEHCALLLLVLEAHLERAHAGETPNLALMRAIVDYLREELERHDRVEALVFARLVERLPWLRALCEVHEEDRIALDRAGARLCEAIERTPEDLTVAGLAFVAALRRRVAVENGELLLAAAAAFEATDWRSIAAAVDARLAVDPKHDERMRARFAALTDEAGCDCAYD